MQKKEKKIYTEDHVVTILEEIKDQFMAFGEGQQIISDKVDNLEGRFDHLEGRFDNLEDRFGVVETKVDRLQDDVTEIKHRLAEKVDLVDFQKLEKRLIKLEKIVLLVRDK